MVTVEGLCSFVFSFKQVGLFHYDIIFKEQLWVFALVITLKNVATVLRFTQGTLLNAIVVIRDAGYCIVADIRCADVPKSLQMLIRIFLWRALNHFTQINLPWWQSIFVRKSCEASKKNTLYINKWHFWFIKVDTQWRWVKPLWYVFYNLPG